MEHVQQNSAQWYKQRLGKFTSSAIADLMVSGRKKDEMWGDTAKTYMEKIAHERMLDEKVVLNEDLFAEYISYMDIGNKYTDWGHRWEPVARKQFEKATGLDVVETDCIDHPEIENLAGSPDGLILSDDGDVESVIEIKCPKPETFVKYASRIKNAEDLKAIKKEYYWQCMNNMFVTGAKKCYFIIFCPWLTVKLHYIEIDANEEEFSIIAERVKAANEEVDNIIASFLFDDDTEAETDEESNVSEPLQE